MCSRESYLVPKFDVNEELLVPLTWHAGEEPFVFGCIHVSFFFCKKIVMLKKKAQPSFYLLLFLVNFISNLTNDPKLLKFFGIFLELPNIGHRWFLIVHKNMNRCLISYLVLIERYQRRIKRCPCESFCRRLIHKFAI